MSDDGVQIPTSALHYVKLFEDAKLLAENKRYDRAYAIAVIGLEEVAKAILAEWERLLPGTDGLQKTRNFHIKKQTALSCLLHAEALAPALSPSRLKDPNRQPPSFEEFRDAWLSGKDRAFLQETFSEDMQNAKHSAFYYDGSDNQTSRNAEDFNKVLDYAKRAILLITNHEVMCVALSLFQSLHDKNVQREGWIL